ncbi:MAG: SIS domain-containing protein [Magnetococcus sp. DMHC-6]
MVNFADQGQEKNTVPPLANFASQIDQFGDLLHRTTITDANGRALTIPEGLQAAVHLLTETRANKRQLFLIGNGGSAAVVSHIANDLLKTGHLRVQTLQDPPMFSCLANDYGYDRVYAEALTRMGSPHDLLIAVSSSGQSPNILNACARFIRLGGRVITLSGFTSHNALRPTGELNFWLDAHHYGMVEIGHLFILHYLAEQIALRAD